MRQTRLRISLLYQARRPFTLLLLSCTFAGTLPVDAHSRHTSQSITASSLKPHEKALQALNRLTFGPRPGEVEAVEATGVDRWIEQQLYPEAIDDSALNARLDSYPALQMSERDLLLKYPPEPVIRAAADGRISIPADPAEHAIYQDRIYAYQQRVLEKATAAAANGASATTPASGQKMPTVAAAQSIAAGMVKSPTFPALTADEIAASPSIKVREQHLYADLAATAIVNLPPADRVAKIVAMSPADADAFQKSLSPPERRALIADLNPQQRELLLALKNPQQLVSGELVASRLLRDVYSNRELQAVMIDFWLNHFNVYLHKNQVEPWYLVDYERNVIAPHAMGRFEDLLVATAESPAMLTYLDNEQSIGPHSEAGLRAQMPPQNGQPAKRDVGLNENYARELMELHTLGVDGGYTQKDVTEVAKVFTGWGVIGPAQKNGTPGFEFNPKRHEPGPKSVLGQTISAGGQTEGLEVLHMLAMSPATAHHVSQELVIRFVSDKPSPGLVNSMAATWMRTGGDIREVLRTMITSPEFWAKDNYRAKVKTPEEFVLSAIRATNGDIVRPMPELDALNQLGMPFYGCQTPNGYPWTTAAWVNTGDLLDRINVALSLVSNKLGVAIDPDSLMGAVGHQAASTVLKDSPQEKAEWMSDAILNGPASPQTQAAILKQIQENPPSVATPAGGTVQKVALTDAHRHGRVELPDSNAEIPPVTDAEAATIAGLLLGSPEFQRR